MAKYTREQRQRAVELYVKYECCAADVIRELGYPSREALRMWHRDWLDEQETGVSSQRGERYARYTEEQKRASVDHYLTHGRRASRTMRQMGYPSKEVLASWIDELAPGERRIRRGPVPGELKRDAVLKVASGELSSREAAEAVGVDSSVVRNCVFCQVGVGRFGVSFSPCERRVSGRFGVGRSCWLLVIALVIA
ncbi:transposase [Bifidobacterium longum]|uniref:transposase n=1 Tax=Bifidobacterium longum TaxID=216816 RepID=UPI00257033D9|nr:transposase [Bifidobacterium longum]MDL5507547.1 transposase [Bifidobacterium longum]